MAQFAGVDPLGKLLQKSDHNIIRDYVTAADHLQYSQLPEGVVAILMTHSNISTQYTDIRLDLHNTIEDVKERFRKHIGTSVDHQRLILKHNGNMICEMSDNSKMLGFYSVISGMEIHVMDTDPFSLSRGGGLTDVSLVQKYKMSDEDYDKRKGTLREFVKSKKKENPNFSLIPKDLSGAPAAEEAPGIESVAGINVGDRCKVNPGARRAEVKFVGEVPGLKIGYWVGVHFDEPVGLSDGTVKGVTIFESSEGHAGFIRGKNVKVGNYPVRDLLASDDEDEDDNEADSGCCVTSQKVETNQKTHEHKETEEDDDEM